MGSLPDPEKKENEGKKKEGFILIESNNYLRIDIVKNIQDTNINPLVWILKTLFKF